MSLVKGLVQHAVRDLHPNKKLQWVTGTSRFLEHKPSLNPSEISKNSKTLHLFSRIYPGLCYTLFCLCCRGWPEGAGHPAPRAAPAGGSGYPTRAREQGLAGMERR